MKTEHILILEPYDLNDIGSREPFINIELHHFKHKCKPFIEKYDIVKFTNGIDSKILKHRTKNTF